MVVDFFCRDIMSAYMQWKVAASSDRLQRAKQWSKQHSTAEAAFDMKIFITFHLHSPDRPQLRDISQVTHPRNQIMTDITPNPEGRSSQAQHLHTSKVVVLATPQPNRIEIDKVDLGYDGF